MASNRMLLIFRPTGRAIILAKKVGNDWVGGTTGLEARMSDFTFDIEDACNANPDLNRDDFYIAMENGDNLPGVLVDGWDYTNNESGVDGVLQLSMSEVLPRLVSVTSPIASKEDAIKILKEGSDIWMRSDADGLKINHKPNPDETWLQMDGYFTKRQLQAILFLMDNQ